MSVDFRFLTFVTDDALYTGCREAFKAGGFTEGSAVFQVVDNRAGTSGDPYTVVNDVLDTMTEAFLIVCHQDVRPAPDTTIHTLRAALAAADAGFPHWAVAGPAGLDMRYEHVAVVDDPHAAVRARGPFPVEAEVLDELLIVVRPGRARLTHGLQGFHFYGADLCVSARRNGGCAVVVDVPMVHLSNGERGRLSPDYRAARDALQAALSPEFRFKVLMGMTSEAMVLSRYRWVRRYLDRWRLRRLAVRLLGPRLVP